MRHPSVQWAMLSLRAASFAFESIQSTLVMPPFGSVSPLVSVTSQPATLGLAEGLALGDRDGTRVGALVASEGEVEGDADGERDGLTVGWGPVASVGAFVAREGLVLGLLDGDVLGLLDGLVLGLAVGGGGGGPQ